MAHYDNSQDCGLDAKDRIDMPGRVLTYEYVYWGYNVSLNGYPYPSNKKWGIPVHLSRGSMQDMWHHCCHCSEGKVVLQEWRYQLFTTQDLHVDS